MIKKPDSVKKTDTPRYPPGIQLYPRWNNSTRTMASARTPSSAGWYANVRFRPAPWPFVGGRPQNQMFPPASVPQVMKRLAVLRRWSQGVVRRKIIRRDVWQRTVPDEGEPLRACAPER